MTALILTISLSLCFLSGMSICLLDRRHSHRLSLRCTPEELCAQGILSAEDCAALRYQQQIKKEEETDIEDEDDENDEEAIAPASTVGRRKSQLISCAMPLGGAEELQRQRRELEARNILMTGTAGDYVGMGQRKVCVSIYFPSSFFYPLFFLINFFFFFFF